MISFSFFHSVHVKSFLIQFFSPDNLEANHLDLKQKLDRMQSLAISLQVQLNQAQSDLTDLRAEKERFERERNDERQALQDALDAAIIERAENDAKWQREYEQLRTLNSGTFIHSVWGVVGEFQMVNHV